MHTPPRALGPASLAATALLVFALLPVALTAQETPERNQVISANPFGLLLDVFNAEYERAASSSTTLGLGGSVLDLEEQTYVNLDGFWRYYPQGTVFDGWSFGAKAGITRVNRKSYPGFGFDVNRSWLMGASGNFYVGLGFGLKRLLATSDADFAPRIIPTFRIVNIGIAF